MEEEKIGNMGLPAAAAVAQQKPPKPAVEESVVTQPDAGAGNVGEPVSTEPAPLVEGEPPVSVEVTVEEPVETKGKKKRG